ncbi:hypothetical protein V7S43_005265 [Phytophthora oleae]|uniref:Uncharacterized protein n=1 Tax=Phytophthora oleae TaxID=2107226 RepID=A0ABD3FSN0_9STRA
MPKDSSNCSSAMRGLAKRPIDDYTSARGEGQDAPPAKVAKITAMCNEFSDRRIPLQLKEHTKTFSHKKTQVKARSYRFSILNEVIHEEIISFLSNQSLTKMQMITGDRYERCEPELARYCCECEDDNPVIGNGLCRQCTPFWASRYKFATRMEAKDIYGLRAKDLDATFLKAPGRSTFLDSAAVEAYMVKTCGSKREWLRYLAKMHVRRKNARAVRM